MRPPLNLLLTGLDGRASTKDERPCGQADAEKNGAAEAKKTSGALRETLLPPAVPEPMPVGGEPVPLHASPSLVNGDESAFELKLRLTPDLADMVEGWARQRLGPDPHGDDGRYRTTSLYC